MEFGSRARVFVQRHAVAAGILRTLVIWVKRHVVEPTRAVDLAAMFLLTGVLELLGAAGCYFPLPA
ncbi:hypothetical protein ABH37_02090 [Mycobacterium haemophilum]|uniref:Uncharacterized protein n=1 Tax=Mycobacterium haemophilum TaxID=29311 RepID=A0A0I9TMP4_9MYCO|nr:hypothetical protein ABH39_11050 [Mycobacterium haemophilum]KLO38435.1 hypothetical protein ABH38_03200 [Mycobacterium haemophilum]KLO44769.1 hypothetical protein ABH37_02090 [Mycobacterium haemophilum]KLO56112.1 hypothetical protein ABH36_02075 [Mycobacterium haemophilum]